MNKKRENHILFRKAVDRPKNSRIGPRRNFLAPTRFLYRIVASPQFFSKPGSFSFPRVPSLSFNTLGSLPIRCSHVSRWSTLMTLGDLTPSGKIINIPKSRTSFESIGIPLGNRVLNVSRSSVPSWYDDRASSIGLFWAMHFVSLADIRDRHQRRVCWRTPAPWRCENSFCARVTTSLCKPLGLDGLV